MLHVFTMVFGFKEMYIYVVLTHDTVYIRGFEPLMLEVAIGP